MSTSSRAPRPRRVLLIDDDAISMELVALLLGHDGHEVVRASDGETAIALLKNARAETSPDTLLVDLQMPGVSGGEVAKQVRAMRGRKPLLLAMSATEVEAEKLRGFDGFLLKPLTLDDLRKALTPNGGNRGRQASGKGTRQSATSSPEADASEAGPATRPAADPIDEGVFQKLQSAMPRSALQELYEVCIADTRARAAALKNQVLAGDLTGVARAGHQIKGAASMVGFARVARLAISLELGSCKEEDTLRLLEDLLSSCDELERILLAGKLQKAL